MAQHFLLTAKARTLSLKSIYQGGEDAAYDTFCKLRWHETNGKAVCPRCDHDDAYKIATRRKFKCKSCHHQFSVTSGTIFASRKMSFTDLLAAICTFINGAKGVSALQMARNLDCQYKTSFVLCHKLRQAMASEIEGHNLDGEVEVDGQHHGGHIRPENRREDRVDRRLAENQTGLRRVVVTARERGGRTLTAVVRYEHQGLDFIRSRVDRNARVFADEAPHWDELHGEYAVGRINHSVAYSDENGKHTNWAESYFSRLRRMVQGQHHHVSPRYLHQYANHAAWMEDHRRESNGELTARAIKLALDHPVSREWKGYWNRAAN